VAHENLKQRTKQFALRIIKVVESLPSGMVRDVMGKQLMRSATSVAANYRASCRAKSNADFISKMGIVEEEADESLFWMEMLVEANAIKQELLTDLMNEADQLIAIVVASINTARGRKR
jgi:four helix bundle protein